MITRYDGTRFITEEEIDKEFLDHWVLITIENPNDRSGYMIASIIDDDDGENYGLITDVALLELDDNIEAKIVYGCKERGGDLHVYLID